MVDEEEVMLERRAKQNWHLEKTVSVSHILTTLAAVGTLAVMGSKFDTRLSLVEQLVAAQHAVDNRQDRDAAASREVVRQQLRDISDKLDRLIERR